MTIDERLEAIAQSIKVLAQMQKETHQMRKEAELEIKRLGFFARRL